MEDTGKYETIARSPKDKGKKQKPRMDSHPFDYKRGRTLKPGQEMPVVDHVLVIGNRPGPYTLPSIEKVWVLYHTKEMVFWGEQRKNQDNVWCLHTERDWLTVKALHKDLQTHLDALADCLRSLGHYPNKLAMAGGYAQCKKNPLCPRVVEAPSPDYPHSPIWEPWE
ncbi:MAG: hypothetical protein WCD18_21065, partial [Thermosynechococcaceae cyanobacterium]